MFPVPHLESVWKGHAIKSIRWLAKFYISRALMIHQSQHFCNYRSTSGYVALKIRGQSRSPDCKGWVYVIHILWYQFSYNTGHWYNTNKLSSKMTHWRLVLAYKCRTHIKRQYTTVMSTYIATPCVSQSACFFSLGLAYTSKMADFTYAITWKHKMLLWEV